MVSKPSNEDSLRASLADLAVSAKGDERLEPHIRSIYTIKCNECRNDVEVDSFLWDREALTPFGYLASCDNCSLNGEQVLSLLDAEEATSFAASGLHRARALERVAPASDPDRQHVVEAISVYLPRSTYVLFTLLNKLDGLRIDPKSKRNLMALLLTACDRANTLWAYPTRRERPRQLTTPSRFRENNIWKALEQSINIWASDETPIPLTNWPDLPPDQGGICLYQGPLRDLADQIQKTNLKTNVKAVISALPRPNQAFWTLSALWTGWLIGRESIGHFKSVLRRRRYDWSWHFKALQSTFQNLEEIIPPNTMMLGLTGEAEPGLITSAIAAAGNSGFQTMGLAIREEQAQIHWKKVKQNTPESNLKNASELGSLASKSIRDFLMDYGQPASYLKVLTAGLYGLDQVGAFIDPFDTQATPEKVDYNSAHDLVRNALTYRGGFLRYGTSESIENHLFWLRNEPFTKPPVHPFSDRLEIDIVTFLVKHPGCAFSDVENAIMSKFHGILPPEREWIEVILRSYGIENPPGTWTLRQEDEPGYRKTDLIEMRRQLSILASRLGYTQQDGDRIVWSDENNLNIYWFYPIVSAVISNLVLGKNPGEHSPANQSFIILPGGRANLIVYKLRQDPRLNQVCLVDDPQYRATDPRIEGGWRFIKTRQLRWLVDNVTTTQESFEALLQLDPITFDTPQIRFM